LVEAAVPQEGEGEHCHERMAVETLPGLQIHRALMVTVKVRRLVCRLAGAKFAASLA
jgi:hypothetical protein